MPSPPAVATSAGASIGALYALGYFKSKQKKCQEARECLAIYTEAEKKRLNVISTYQERGLPVPEENKKALQMTQMQIEKYRVALKQCPEM
ncbi:MAG: hypothetical protein K0R66_171 [Gammaproteobacteria bacterium]|jgi:hypothetical protein|nr:hypothetical protein [Gammaproteobacteria bacterium]